MTNGYNTGYIQGTENQFYPQYQQNYQVQGRKQNLFTDVAAASLIGFAGGTAVTAGIDYYKNRKPVNNDNVTDSFAKRVMDRIIKKDYVAKGKKFFNQKADILKNIDYAKTPEKFKKLMEKNKEFCKTLCDGISLETMCKTLTKDNIKEKISAIKQRVEASLQSELQNIKDVVKACWDSENKKFVKPDNVDDKLFKIIKNTKYEINWKKAAKYGGITAGVLGALTLGLAMLSGKAQQR